MLSSFYQVHNLPLYNIINALLSSYPLIIIFSPRKDKCNVEVIEKRFLQTVSVHCLELCSFGPEEHHSILITQNAIACNYCLEPQVDRLNGLLPALASVLPLQGHSGPFLWSAPASFVLAFLRLLLPYSRDLCVIRCKMRWPKLKRLPAVYERF